MGLSVGDLGEVGFGGKSRIFSRIFEEGQEKKSEIMSISEIKKQNTISMRDKSSSLKKSDRIFSKQEIIKILKDNLDNFAKFGVTKIGLFGSFVREEQTEESDVDLLVHLCSSNWDNFCQLLDFTETLFEGRKVDIVTKNSITGYAGVNIGKEVEYVK